MSTGRHIDAVVTVCSVNKKLFVRQQPTQEAQVLLVASLAGNQQRMPAPDKISGG